MCNQSKGALGEVEFVHWVLGFLGSFWPRVHSIKVLSIFLVGFMVGLELFV